MEFKRTGPGRSGWGVPAAAAAVAAVILAAELVGGEGTSAGPGPTPGPTPDVPPVSRAGQPPPCRAAQLTASAEEPEGTAGAWQLTVHVRRVSGPVCVLQGYPDVQPLGAGRWLGVSSVPDHGPGVYRGPVVLTADASALLSLTWSGLWCATAVSNDTIHAQLPDGGGTLTFTGFGEVSDCAGDRAAGLTPINVRPFAPED